MRPGRWFREAGVAGEGGAGLRNSAFRPIGRRGKQKGYERGNEWFSQSEGEGKIGLGFAKSFWGGKPLIAWLLGVGRVARSGEKHARWGRFAKRRLVLGVGGKSSAGRRLAPWPGSRFWACAAK